MSLEPQKRLLTRPKRLPGKEEVVTICAAAINRESESKPASIIIACDQNLSLAGGAMSVDGAAWKLRRLNAKWGVMFSGDTSSLFALRDAVMDVAEGMKKVRIRTFARLCCAAYREERRKIIETDILAKYDIENYAEYLSLKQEHRPLFDAITSEIESLQEGWSLLVFGFDDIDEPHIFVICDYGKIQYCDIEGFAVIGSGTWAAQTALAAFPFNRYLRLGEAIFSLMSAKFAAEAADAVGRQSALMIFKPDDGNRSIPGVLATAFEKHREAWKKLPRIPDGAAQTLERDMEQIKPFRVKLPRRKKHRAV